MYRDFDQRVRDCGRVESCGQHSIDLSDDRVAVLVRRIELHDNGVHARNDFDGCQFVTQGGCERRGISAILQRNGYEVVTAKLNIRHGS